MSNGYRRTVDSAMNRMRYQVTGLARMGSVSYRGRANIKTSVRASLWLTLGDNVPSTYLLPMACNCDVSFRMFSFRLDSKLVRGLSL
jgi:hypothetical protein